MHNRRKSLRKAVCCDSNLKSGIQQFNAVAGNGETSQEMAEAILEFIPPEQYPYLHRMASRAMQTGYDAEADFAFGLEIILDGLERILGEQHL